VLGLRAYRQPEKLFNASGLNLPLTDVPVRLNQRLAFDPCLPSLIHLAMFKVTSLEPRTLRQPGKLQNVSKNEVVFTPLSFIVNKKCGDLNRLHATECGLSTRG
jgi:hypothetical protein